MCCKCCGVTQRKIWVFGCGTFLALIALIIGLVWPTIALKILHSQLVLEKGSVNYDNWIETPIPMYLEVTLFHWTNPDKIHDPTVKPNFEERGPYVFKEKHNRVDLDWHKNKSISFNQVRTWNFEPDLSNGSLSDQVTAANVLTATMANMMKHEKKIIKIVVNHLFNTKGGSLTKTKSAGEWIFDGYDDPLLDFVKKLNLSNVNIPFKKFGWLVERNLSKTFDGRFTMNTGQDDIYELGMMSHWNGENHTKFYRDECGIVNGSTGELWPPGLNPERDVTIFATDICRYVTLYPSSSITKHGIDGRTWKANDRVFDSGTKYPEMKCFCPANATECPKNGVADVSECRYGAPVYVSFPHFYLADPSFVDAVSGIKPDARKHEFTLSLETTTGIPLDVNARLQINMLMQPSNDFDIFKGVQEVMMPMFWFRQKAELDDEFAKQAKLAVALPNIGVYTAYGLGSLGVLIIIIGIILTLTKKWTRRNYDDEEPLSN